MNTAQYVIPRGYKPACKVREIETAIKGIKDHFEQSLASQLGLQRITAPLFIDPATGLNDNLNGIEKPVEFYAAGLNKNVEIVQSLAKWKRYALHKYGFKEGEGLYTDMNAVRPDETLSPIHSFYVDQWDWCKVIRPRQRSLTFLKAAVESIFTAVKSTEYWVCSRYPQIKPILPDKITFVTSEGLRSQYPKLSPKERETEVCREAGAVFVIGIGGVLADGTMHDGRAPDYDDWSTPRTGGVGLNGDIMLWHPKLETALEISSMGIRVNAEALRRQLMIRRCEDRAQLPFHRGILSGELPQTIGGGIGQSRLALFMLRAVHIGEVACGLWSREMIELYAAAGITLL
ncbi:MAG: aspartate--ammonia ligase [Planctomycetaceae bacterium]|jgi:aspartate--ammonia ligase|nr:aspartate--ammonia ligase [Planctomycetaceae bacterium]